MTSMSRKISRWVADITYDDLPSEVIDRAKGVTLQALSSVLLGYTRPEAKQALAMMREEETGGGGAATCLVTGAKMTKAGAALVNAETIFSGGKWDTFRMLTHPGCAIIPAALAAAETNGASGKTFLIGIVAGYEIMERMAADFIPTVMSRGFHSGPVFGIFGAAVAASKIMGLDANTIHGAIAQCVNLASGNLEGIRSGGRALREGGAVRNALLAVAMARHGAQGGETVLEGEAGFYHSYTGNNAGKLQYSFTADDRASLDKVIAGLGEDWMILETLYRIYSTPGFNIAHVDVTAALCAEHDIKYDDVERIESIVNWLETEYPSPAFPSRSKEARPDSPHYYTAWGVVRRSFPLLKCVEHGIGEKDPERVLELMHRVMIVPSHRHPLFAPQVTIHLRGGRSISKTATGKEFIFNFDTLAARMKEIACGTPVGDNGYDNIVSTCRRLDRASDIHGLIQATIPT